MTLQEVLIAITVLLIGLMLMTGNLITSHRTQATLDAFIQVHQEARRAIDRMSQELREAGNVNNNTDMAAAQRLDFQIARGYNATPVAQGGCGGTCWGSEQAVNQWLHYALDTTDANNPRLLRWITAGRLDALPANFAGCQVLANDVTPALAQTAFTYDHPARTVTIQLHTSITSRQLPGGTLGLPNSLITRIRLRNTP